MKVEELVAKLENEFEDLEKGVLHPDYNFREMEDWSSMHALVVIALIDSEYDVLLNGNDLKGAETIRDLFNIIENRLS